MIELSFLFFNHIYFLSISLSILRSPLPVVLSFSISFLHCSIPAWWGGLWARRLPPQWLSENHRMHFSEVFLQKVWKTQKKLSQFLDNIFDFVVIGFFFVWIIYIWKWFVCYLYERSQKLKGYVIYKFKCVMILRIFTFHISILWYSIKPSQNDANFNLFNNQWTHTFNYFISLLVPCP